MKILPRSGPDLLPEGAVENSPGWSAAKPWESPIFGPARPGGAIEFLQMVFAGAELQLNSARLISASFIFVKRYGARNIPAKPTAMWRMYSSK